MVSAVQAAAAAHVAIVRVARVATGVVSRETRKAHQVRAVSIPSSAAVSDVVAAAHHLRLRKAEMVAGVTTEELLRKPTRS
jgi:hypothetical protein